MNKAILAAIALLAGANIAYAEPAATKGKPAGQALFEKHCTVCHPNGGNIVNKNKGLKKGDLEKNGIKSWKDVVAVMRKPGPGMNPFGKKELSDKDARAIAEYVLKTFK